MSPFQDVYNDDDETKLRPIDFFIDATCMCVHLISCMKPDTRIIIINKIIQGIAAGSSTLHVIHIR